MIILLCFAFAGSDTLQAQITKDGVKIRLFTKDYKGKSREIKDISRIIESGLYCCAGDETFDRIELTGNASITIIVRDGSASENYLGEVVYLNKYYLDKKAIFKLFEGREYMGSRFTVFIKSGDVILLQFEYEFLSCT
jgi:hypothetical protein